VIIVVGSILFGKPATAASVKLPAKIAPAAPAPVDASVVGHYGSAGTLKIPGTAVLVSVFFVAFVLYYFVNWKYLSEVWPLR
jgi:cytochrome c oxidase subunit 1